MCWLSCSHGADDQPPLACSFERGGDEGVGRRADAELLAQADDRAGQPGELEAAAVLEVVQQRGLHRRGQMVGAGERAGDEVRGRSRSPS